MNKNILIVVLLLVIGVFAFLQFKPKAVKDTSPVAVVPSDQTQNGDELDETVTTKTNWGVSFINPSGWKPTINTNRVTFLQQGGQSEGDEITIDYISGNSITDTDAKFGSITYSYDSTRQTWVETNDQEGEGISPHTTPTPATPVTYTTSGLPVFRGTRRWLTYIVPLSHTTFLKLNISGSGYTQTLTDFVKTIKKI